MANGIFDPNIVETGAGVREAEFQATAAPLLTLLGGTLVGGPLIGAGLALLQGMSTQMDLKKAEDRERFAVADFENRMRIANSLFNRAMGAIDSYSEIPGVSEEQAEFARAQAANLLDQSLNFDPNISAQARTQLSALPEALRSSTQQIDFEALTRQRDIMRDTLLERQRMFDDIQSERTRKESDIDEALTLLNNDDFRHNDPVQRGRLLNLLDSTLIDAQSFADAASNLGAGIPLVTNVLSYLGGQAKAEEIQLSRDEWRDIFLAARSSITGTAEQASQGILNAAMDLNPQVQVLKSLPPGFTAVDFITGAVPEFNDPPQSVNIPEREPIQLTAETARLNAGMGPGGDRVEMVDESLSRRFAESIGRVEEEASPAEIAEVLSNIRRRLPDDATGSNIGFDERGRLVAELPNGEVRAIGERVTESERRILEQRRRRAQRLRGGTTQ